LPAATEERIAQWEASRKQQLAQQQKEKEEEALAMEASSGDEDKEEQKKSGDKRMDQMMARATRAGRAQQAKVLPVDFDIICFTPTNMIFSSLRNFGSLDKHGTSKNQRPI